MITCVYSKSHPFSASYTHPSQCLEQCQSDRSRHSTLSHQPFTINIHILSAHCYGNFLCGHFSVSFSKHSTAEKLSVSLLAAHISVQLIFSKARRMPAYQGNLSCKYPCCSVFHVSSQLLGSVCLTDCLRDVFYQFLRLLRHFWAF